MRASRLLSMLLLLQARGGMPAPALAREFEVSVRTIHRDVEALSAAGVPVYAEPGRTGGIRLRAGWRTRVTGLTPDEAAAVPFAGFESAAEALGIGSAAGSAQLKLLAGLPPEAHASARRIAARFHVDPAPWYHRAEFPPLLPALAAAVWDERRLRLDYESWTGRVTRDVDPLGVVQKGGLWYLVAAVRGAPRTFRVTSVLAIEPRDGAVVRPARFDLARYWRAWSEDFEARLLRGRATVRLSPEACRILRAVSPASAELAARTQRPWGDDGWIECELPTEGTEYSARQLLRLGAEFEVRAPAELRAEVAREARRVAARHAAVVRSRSGKRGGAAVRGVRPA